MCFVVFCVVLRVFCDVLRVLSSVFECFAVFPQNTQNTRKTSKNTGKHKKITIRSCIAGVFQEQKNSTVLHKTLFTKHLLQNTAKHRKTPQKQSQNAFCERNYVTKHCKMHAKRLKTSQNAHNTNTATIRIARICFFFQNTLDLSRKHTIRNIRVNYGGGGHVPAGGHVAGLWMFFKNSVLRCFTVFCGVLRYVFYVRVFSVFHKTAQNRPKSIQNAQSNEQNTLCAIQRNTVLCIFLSLRK